MRPYRLTYTFTIYYQNMGGIRTKLKDLRLASLTSTYDIIIVTESWLHDGITDSEVLNPNYTIYRRDRTTKESTKGDGGGSFIAVSNRLRSTRIRNLESYCEDVWVSVTDSGGELLTVCAVYIPPDSNVPVYNKFFDQLSDKLCNHKNKVMIFGDFNISAIKWTRDVSGLWCNPSTSYVGKALSLFDFMSQNNFYQLNHMLNSNSNTLDLILSSFAGPTVNESLNPLCKVGKHHPPLDLEVSLGCTNNKVLKPRKFAKYNFKRADYTIVNEKLSQVEWRSLLESCDNVDSMVAAFYSSVEFVIKNNIPKARSHSGAYPSWFSTSLLKMLREKEKKRKTFKKTNNPRDRLEFELLRSRVHSKIKTDYRKFVESVESSLVNNPKKFWSFIKVDGRMA